MTVGRNLASLPGPLLGRPNEGQHFASSEAASEATWPSPLCTEALHGPAGEFVRVIGPHSEADPAALLFQFLIEFGNAVGRGPHFTVEADRHGMNLFGVAVGKTSKGRKGTSEGRVRSVLLQCDPVWAEHRIMSGLSSGEGLIWAVRDPIPSRQPICKKVPLIGCEEIESDVGVDDKRLLIFEPEFVSVLRQLDRDGNTLSATIRQAWDSGNLRTMTKKSPAVATGAHISIIAHVTVDELRRSLSATEQGNGFANRYLWFCSARSKFLPDDEDRWVPPEKLATIVEKIRSASRFAQKVGKIQRDEAARDFWRQIYRDLSSGKPGLLGAVTSRAEAQTMRLACIYAILDESSMVRQEHLRAALGVWEYVESSCKYIFGDALGDPIADTILAALRGSPEGLARTGISGLFGRNKPAAAIARALDALASLGLARPVTVETGGRAAEMWRAC